MKKLAKFNIEFVEQPVISTEHLIKLAEKSKTNIAGDESLSNYEEAIKILEYGKIKYFVLKPSIRMGIYGTLKIIEFANNSDIKIIISSAFETAIGRLTLLYLASLVNHSLAHGLSTQLLGENIFKASSELNAPIIDISKKSFNPKYKEEIFLISLSNSEHWLTERAKLSGEDKWIILNEKEFTFMAIQKLSKQAASYFHKLGINKDDHVAILSENNVEFIISVFALWLLGAVPIPINTRSKDEELKSLIEISHSKYLVEVCDKSSSKPLSNIKTIKFTLENICDFNQYNELFPFQPNNTALMLFTSGSSGIPKCVLLTFENLFYSAISSNEFIKHNKDDLWLASLPFYHIGGFSIITRSLLFGCSLVIPRSIKIFDIIETIEKFSPSLLSVVPTMLNKLIEKEVKPWQKLRIMFLGGGPTSEKLINRAIKNMFPIVLVYGSTETSSMITFCSVENLLKNGISSGKPFDGVEIEIMVNKNLSSEDKNIGCIAVKSGSVAQAYYNNFIEDKESFKNGKFFTNDLGYIDKNGNLNIIGRMDEIIISGGENISLLEIRKLLLRKIVKHNFEVIGVKDNKWDQSYIIIVETTDREVEKEIDTLLRSKLASYKLPQNIYCINEIPRNEMGKIQKEKLKQTVKVDFL